MAKIQTSLLLEEATMNRVRATAKRMRWTLTDAAELAFKLFLEEFENAEVISVLTFEKDPDATQLPALPLAEAETPEAAR